MQKLKRHITNIFLQSLEMLLLQEFNHVGEILFFRKKAQRHDVSRFVDACSWSPEACKDSVFHTHPRNLTWIPNTVGKRQFLLDTSFRGVGAFVNFEFFEGRIFSVICFLLGEV